MLVDAIKVNISFENSHLKLIPSLRSITTRSSSAGNLEVLVRHSNWTCDLDTLLLGVPDNLVGNLLDGGELDAADGDSESLVGLVDLFALLFDISHCGENN